MKRFIKALPVLLLAMMVIGAPSCKKKTTEPQPTEGSMKVRFDYVFGANQVPWQVGNTYTHSKTGDVITFSLFKYYVSNIKLKKSDGTWWSQPNSYFLLDAKTTEESTISINNIPVGDYVEMEYMMGVDSEKNVTGANDGALSFIHGMYWDWNSGYIMLKCEGTSPSSPVVGNTFALHLGGFTGDNNVITVKNTNFSGSTLKIDGKTTHTVKLVANPARLWHTSPGLDSIYVIHSPGPDAVRMAKDFYGNIYYSGME